MCLPLSPLPARCDFSKAGGRPTRGPGDAPHSDFRADSTDFFPEALTGGHEVLVLIAEVWGGFSPESMRFLGELAQARGDGVDLERASATWSTTSFTSYHGQLLSLAVQWGVAIEIERSIHKRARFA